MSLFQAVIMVSPSFVNISVTIHAIKIILVSFETLIGFLASFHKLASIYNAVRQRPMLGNSNWQKHPSVEI